MFASWLTCWTWWRSKPLQHWQVVMYTRQGCHLCEIAWKRLLRARRRYGFTLSGIDVDTDPRLVQEHGLQVPVVEINGKVRFRGRINEVLFRRLIEAELRRERSG
jgi:glutaredoxin